MNRRDLLRNATALSLSTVAGRVWAAPKADARLLVVFLRGAYDAANVVIPTGSDFYYRVRPNLAVAKQDTLALDGDWGLHPALRDTIMPLYAKGQAAFVPFAGTDDLTRSHFETQDTIELGQTIGASRDYNSGFMARLAAELTRVRPIAFTEQLPLIFRGGAEPVPNIAINGVGKPAIDDRQAALIAAMYKDTPLANAVAEGFRCVTRSTSRSRTMPIRPTGAPPRPRGSSCRPGVSAASCATRSTSASWMSAAGTRM